MSSRVRVLIVEDEIIVARDLQIQLTRLGYQVLGVASQADASIQLARRHKPDLVLMDIRLQGEVDGIEAADVIQRDLLIPVIFLTAHADEQTIQRAQRTSPFGYVLKPFEERELRTAIEMALYKHASETRLRQDERRYATTLNSIGDAVIATNDQGRITFINPVAEACTGWKADEARGRLLDEVFRIVEEGNRRSLATPVARVLRDKTPVELVNSTVLLARDGREVLIEDSAAPIIDDQGQCTGVVLVFRDVTERRRMQRRLRESEARKAAIFHFALDAIVILDVQGRIAEWNPAAQKFFGYTLDDIHGKTLQELLLPYRTTGEKLPWDFTNPTREAFWGWRHELLGRRKDGSTFPVEAALTSFLQDDQALYIAFVRDLTVPKQLEEQLRQVQKMQGIGQLAGGIAHDFNNLLTVITGYGSVLLNSISGDHTWHSYVEQIMNAGERATHLTRQLLAFSRKSLVQPRLLNLNAVVQSMLKMLGRLIGETIVVRTELDSDPALILADNGQMEQVILNLAINARDAMPGGGTLTISTARIDAATQPPQEYPTLPPGVYERLIVADTGCGMDEAVKARIFEPFFTTKEVGKGTGMGLATVYAIAQQCQGRIFVNSAPGQGASFHLLFPAAAGTLAEPTAAHPTEGFSKGQGEHILLVEDDDSVRFYVKRLLEMNGYHVHETSNGADALDLERRLAPRLDLLVSDMVMPSLNGQQLWNELRKRRPNLKVLFLTGYTDTPLTASANDPEQSVLLKPFSPEKLLNATRKLIEGK
jgi:PAS domain S-box-containing protein